jgi:adenylate kinase
MKPQQCHTSRASPLFQALLLTLVFVLPYFVTCNPTAVTKSRSLLPTQHTKLWGIVPKLIDSSIPKHIIVMGGPASGKGTQCQKLADKYGLVHISSGDLLRQAVSSNDGGPAAPHISIIKECMEAGKLIPDSLMTRLILDRLRSRDCRERGYILDGYPRTLAQAKSLQDAGISPDVFLLLNVRDEEAIKRVIGRRTDSVTGKVYHLEFNPPPNDAEVRKRLIIRADDTLESMKVRLKQFRENVASVEDWYRDIKREVDGSSTPREVSRDIDATLKQMRKRKQRA